jgi:hypothetical protein
MTGTPTDGLQASKPVGESAPKQKQQVLSSSTMKMKFMLRKGGGGGAGAGTVTGSGVETGTSAMGAGCAPTEDRDVFSQLPGRRSFGGFNRIVERQYVEQCADLGFRNVYIGVKPKEKVREMSHASVGQSNRGGAEGSSSSSSKKGTGKKAPVQTNEVQGQGNGQGQGKLPEQLNPWGEEDEMLQLRPDKAQGTARTFKGGKLQGGGNGGGHGKKKDGGKSGGISGGKGGGKRAMGDGGLSGRDTQASRAKKRRF